MVLLKCKKVPPSVAPVFFLPLSFFTLFHSLLPPHSAFVSVWMVHTTRTLLPLIYSPLYLRGVTRHNEEGWVRLLSLSMIALLPQLCFLYQRLPVVLPAQWKTVLPLVLTQICSVEHLIFTAHALPLPPSAVLYLSFPVFSPPPHYCH